MNCMRYDVETQHSSLLLLLPHRGATEVVVDLINDLALVEDALKAEDHLALHEKRNGGQGLRVRANGFAVQASTGGWQNVCRSQNGEFLDRVHHQLKAVTCGITRHRACASEYWVPYPAPLMY